MLLTLTLAAHAAIVTPSPAAPAPPVLPAAVAAARVPGGDDTFQLVTLTTRDRVRLSASYWPPAKQKNRVPGALLVHDAGASRTQLEEVIDKYKVARAEALGVACSCDAALIDRDTCMGWDEFSDRELARFHEDWLGEKVELIDMDWHAPHPEAH